MPQRPEDISPHRTVRSVVDVLRKAKPCLERRYHIRALGIFGSYARNEQGPGSEIEEPIGRDVVDEKVDLERVLGVSVDLALKGGVARRPGLFRAIEEDAVYV